MITVIYPFPLIGWLIALIVLFSCPTRLRAIRYGITLGWLFFGAGGARQVPFSRIPLSWEQPILLLDKILGPGASQASRFASKYIPALILWSDVPLRFGFSHPNVYISAAGFVIVFVLQELCVREYGRRTNDH